MAANEVEGGKAAAHPSGDGDMAFDLAMACARALLFSLTERSGRPFVI